jgi:hypothetical protein
MKLEGLLNILAVTSATFQSQFTAQLQERSALYFVSLIKSLNFAGLLKYFAAHH